MGGGPDLYSPGDSVPCLGISFANSVIPARQEACQVAIQVNRLPAIAAALSRGNPLDPGDVVLLTASLAVAGRRHQREIDAEVRRQGLAERDRLIGAVAGHYNGTIRARAQAVLSAANNYASSGWRHHRASTACPEEIHGTTQGLLWMAFKSHPTFPTGLRQLHTIISKGERAVLSRCGCTLRLQSSLPDTGDKHGYAASSPRRS